MTELKMVAKAVITLHESLTSEEDWQTKHELSLVIDMGNVILQKNGDVEQNLVEDFWQAVTYSL